MNQEKLVSVVIPTYKSVKYLYKSVYSIVNQSYKNIEIIIIDDTPIDDGTKKIIDSFNDERIVYIKPKNRLGMVKSLNYAISLAKGEYIARMDADDISHKDRFLKQVEYLNNNKQVGVVGCAYYTIDESDKITGSYTHPQFDNEIKAKMLFNTALAHPTVMIRKLVLLECDNYNEQCFCCEDYELWSRMMKITQFHNLQEKLFKYRILKNSAMQSQLYKIKTDATYYKKHTAVLKMIYDNVLSYFNTEGQNLSINYVDMLFAKKIDNISFGERKEFLKKCEKLIFYVINKKNNKNIIYYQWIKMSMMKIYKTHDFDYFFGALRVMLRLAENNMYARLAGILFNNKNLYDWKL